MFADNLAWKFDFTSRNNAPSTRRVSITLVLSLVLAKTWLLFVQFSAAFLGWCYFVGQKRRRARHQLANITSCRGLCQQCRRDDYRDQSKCIYLVGHWVLSYNKIEENNKQYICGCDLWVVTVWVWEWSTKGK